MTSVVSPGLPGQYRTVSESKARPIRCSFLPLNY